jgi:hypothetical protein
LVGGDIVVKGEKSSRLCPIKDKEVGCDGVCEAVSKDGVKICTVRLKALDLALNG